MNATKIKLWLMIFLAITGSNHAMLKIGDGAKSKKESRDASSQTPKNRIEELKRGIISDVRSRKWEEAKTGWGEIKKIIRESKKFSTPEETFADYDYLVADYNICAINTKQVMLFGGLEDIPPELYLENLKNTVDTCAILSEFIRNYGKIIFDTDELFQEQLENSQINLELMSLHYAMLQGDDKQMDDIFTGKNQIILNMQIYGENSVHEDIDKKQKQKEETAEQHARELCEEEAASAAKAKTKAKAKTQAKIEVKVTIEIKPEEKKQPKKEDKKELYDNADKLIEDANKSLDNARLSIISDLDESSVVEIINKLMKYYDEKYRLIQNKQCKDNYNLICDDAESVEIQQYNNHIEQYMIGLRNLCKLWKAVQNKITTAQRACETIKDDHSRACAKDLGQLLLEPNSILNIYAIFEKLQTIDQKIYKNEASKLIKQIQDKMEEYEKKWRKLTHGNQDRRWG